MKTRAGRFAYDVKSLHISGAMLVHDHAAAGVVCCRNNGYSFLSDIKAQLGTSGFHCGKVFFDLLTRLMRDV